MKTKKTFWLILALGIIILILSGVYVYNHIYFYQAKANRIINHTGVKGGLIAHVGFNNGKLTSALHINDRYIVHGICRDMEKIQKARQYIRNQDLYGKVTVQPWQSETLPYSDNLINLLLVENPELISKEEMMRVLSPQGVAYVNKNGDWTKWVKPRSDAIDKWTHYLHGPSNNPVANDTLVGPPRRLQWKSEPTWTRSHEYLSSFAVMVSDDKRIFYIFDDGLTGITGSQMPDKWTLYARNAYNGVLLWKRELKNWNDPEVGAHTTELRGTPSMMQRILVANENKVFTTIEYHGPIKVLNAATGETIKTIQGTDGTEEIIYSNGVLYARITSKQKNGQDRIAAFNPNNGNIIWEKFLKNYTTKSLAASDGKLVYGAGKYLVCRQADNGKKLWKVNSTLINNYGWSRGPKIVLSNNKVLIRNNHDTEARDLNTGTIVWNNKTQMGPLRGSDMFVIDSLVWQRGDTSRNPSNKSFLRRRESHQPIVGYSLENGNKVKMIRPDSIFSIGHHLRCYPARATSSYILPQFRGVEFVDLNGQSHSQNDWTRGPCRYGVLPCNGLLYVPPHPCFCYPGAMMKGLNAYSTASTRDIKKEITRSRVSTKRLEYGPAWNEEATDIGDKEPDSWPMYRHDNRRTNATDARVEGRLTKAWQTDLGDNLTPPVSAGGQVYVSDKDRNTVYAVDIQDGEILWERSTGGRVDSPPTLYKGKVLFGSADGWVYCLRQSDGELIWRFRAAPSPRLMVNKNRVESPWRVHGSVLLHDGLIYLTSGRSSFLDGGIFIYALNPNTGEMVHKTRLDTWMRTREDAEDQPFLPAFHIEGSRSDLLVSEGGYIYLGQMKFTPELKKIDPSYRKGPENYKTDRGSPDAYGPIVKGDSISKNPTYNFVHKETIEQYPSLANIWYRRGHMGARNVGKHLFATGGFLDDSYFNRIYWMYSKTWPGYYIANVASKTGQLLVIGPEKTYGVNAFNERVELSPQFTPGKQNYLLFADDNNNEPVLTEENWGRDKGMGFSRSQPPQWFDWVPVRIRGMVLAGDRFFMAGPPDVIDPDDPMAAFEGRKGGMLWNYKAKNGKQIAKYSLAYPPVFDGMIAVKNRILISTTEGSLICLNGDTDS